MTNFRAGIILFIGLFSLVGFASLIVFFSERREELFTSAIEAAETARTENRLEASEAAYREALELAPQSAEAATALFDLIAFFKPEDAEAVLDQMAANGMAKAAYLPRRAELALTRGDREAARAALEALPPTDDPDLLAETVRLELLLTEDNAEEALPLFTELTEAYPEDPRLQFINARVLGGQEDILSRVKAKEFLLELLEESGEFAFRAAVEVLLTTSHPYLVEDHKAAREALLAHPWRAAGIEKLSTPILRRLVLSISSEDPALAYELGGQLLERPETDREDQLTCLYIAQEAGKAAAMDSLVAELNLINARDERGSILMARQELLAGNPAAALNRLEALLANDPESVNGYRVLNWIGDKHFNTLNDAEKARLCRVILAHPAATADRSLNVATALLDLDPENREALISAMVNRFAEGDPGQLALWLLASDAPGAALDVIPEERALAETELFSLRFDALLKTGEEEAATALLKAGSPALEEWRIAFFHAGSMEASGDIEACAEALWRSLDKLGTRGERALFNIASMARRNNLAELQFRALEMAYAAGLVFPERESLIYLRMLINRAEMEKSLRFSAYCRTLFPGNPVYTNNHVYLQLVNERDIEGSITDMEAVVAENPDQPAFRLTLALAELLGGYPGKARDTLGPLQEERFGEDPRSLFSMALVIAGSGDRNDANDLAGTINARQLMPAERALLDLYLRDGQFRERHGD